MWLLSNRFFLKNQSSISPSKGNNLALLLISRKKNIGGGNCLWKIPIKRSKRTKELCEDVNVWIHLGVIKTNKQIGSSCYNFITNNGPHGKLECFSICKEHKKGRKENKVIILYKVYRMIGRLQRQIVPIPV